MNKEQYIELQKQMKEYENSQVELAKEGLPKKLLIKANNRYYALDCIYFSDKYAEPLFNFKRRTRRDTYYISVEGYHDTTEKPKTYRTYENYHSLLRFVEDKLDTYRNNKKLTVGEQEKRLEFWDLWHNRIMKHCPHDFESKNLFSRYTSCQLCGIEKEE